MKPEPLRGKGGYLSGYNRDGYFNECVFYNDDVKSASDFYLKYKDLDGKERLRLEEPEIYALREKYISDAPQEEGKNQDYNEWLFRFAFGDVI